MKFNRLLLWITIGYMAGFVSPTWAATVGFDTNLAPFAAGQTIELSIEGNFSETDAIMGGGLNLHYDPDVVRIQSVVVNASVFEFHSSPGKDNRDAGTWEGIQFSTFQGASGQFNIASLSIVALASGVSPLQLSENPNYPFASLMRPGDGVQVSFLSSSVTVIPLPGALWLLIAGFSTLGFVLKPRPRRTIQPI